MTLSRAALLLMAAPAFLAAGCRSPDLSPIREGLVKEAAVVCAPPPARPAHAPKVREVSEADVAAALTSLCDTQHNATSHAAPEAVLHDALLGDRAVVGQARRPENDDHPEPGKCRPSFAQLDRVLLDDAEKAQAKGLTGEALDRCADVIASARDEDLTGAVTSLLLANSELQHAVQACLPIVEHAPKGDAARFHASLAILRPTFPTSLDGVAARDHAETLLMRFGPARADGAPLACPRATLLASDRNPKPETPEKLLARWRASQEGLPPEELAKYQEAYTLTLGALDRLVSLAEVASK